MARTDRESRIKRAVELISDHPQWGKDRVNAQIKREFGVGLRTTDVAKLKQATLLVKPIVGKKRIDRLIELDIPPHLPRETLVKIGFEEQYHRMRSCGFLDFEIRHILSAGNLPMLFETKPFNAMLRDRLTWVKRMRKAGWTKEQVIFEIKRYYSKPERSPFDFLRKEYKPPLKVDFKIYREAARQRAERETSSLYRARKPKKVGR